MATVPHPVPSRMAHDIAALYGRDDDTLVAWQRACAQAADTLRGAHDEERLRKALTLAQDGHVTLEDGYATVDSRGTRYTVQADGSCNCPDFLQRGVPCKHALAVQMTASALGLVVPPSPPTPAPAAPRVHGWKPTPKTSATWDVHEAPASACFKFRVGSLELLYTLRGVNDAELLQRMAATLPTLQEVIEACEDRAEQRRLAGAAAPAAPTASPAPAAAEVHTPASPPPAQPDLQALVQQALQAVLAQAQAHTNGHASPAPTPDDQTTGVCSLHQAAMEQRSDPENGDTWYSHYVEDEQRYCKGARPTRRHGKSRR